VTVDNQATIGSNVGLDTHGLSLTAAMRKVGDDETHTLSTAATSGGGGGKVGIAGSLALTIADFTTNTQIMPPGPPGDSLNGSPLTLSSTASVESTARAKAKDDEATTVGIGAGVSINIVNDRTTASIDSGRRFNPLSKPSNVSLTAKDTDSMTTYAEAGT